MLSYACKMFKFNGTMYFSQSCSIEVPLSNNVVIVSGSRVQMYTISGPSTQLPDLQQSRRDPACGYFYDSGDQLVNSKYRICYYNKKQICSHTPYHICQFILCYICFVQVYLVTGGEGSDYTYLATTELLSQGSSSWLYAGELPSPRFRPRAATLDNKLILTGVVRVWCCAVLHHDPMQYLPFYFNRRIHQVRGHTWHFRQCL